MLQLATTIGVCSEEYLWQGPVRSNPLFFFELET